MLTQVELEAGRRDHQRRFGGGRFDDRIGAADESAGGQQIIRFFKVIDIHADHGPLAVALRDVYAKAAQISGIYSLWTAQTIVSKLLLSTAITWSSYLPSTARRCAFSILYRPLWAAQIW